MPMSKSGYISGSLSGLVALMIVVGWSGVATADILPPGGERRVESCTESNMQSASEVPLVCERCGDAYHGAPDACFDRYAGTDFSRSCRSQGASVWHEIWCRPATEAEAAELAAQSAQAGAPVDAPGDAPGEAAGESNGNPGTDGETAQDGEATSPAAVDPQAGAATESPDASRGCRSTVAPGHAALPATFAFLAFLAIRRRVA